MGANDLANGRQNRRNGLQLRGFSPQHAVFLAAARCSTAGVALHASAVADQSVVAAFAAGFALVPLHLCLGARINAHCPA